MYRMCRLAAIGIALLFNSDLAKATLIGTTVNVQHNSGEIGIVQGGRDFTVIVESGVVEIENVINYSVDIEDSSIYLDFNLPAHVGQQKWGDIGEFNGPVFAGLLPIIDGTILEVVVNTNLRREFLSEEPWGDSRIILTSGILAFDWRNLIYDTDSFFEVELITTNIVSEPPATAFITAMTLIVAVARMGKNKKR